MNKLLIENGRVVDPANRFDQVASLYIADKKIVAVASQPEGFTPDRVIDATGLTVCPGLIDMSARLKGTGQNHEASVVSEIRAAAAGGVTSVCLPPDTTPVIDTPAVVEYIKDKAQQARYAQVYPIAALTQQLGGLEISSMHSLKEAGCIAVSNADKALSNLQILRRAMEYADSHDLLLIYRPEESSLNNSGCAHEGAVASRYGLPGIPSAAETVAVAQCLELAELTGCRVHFSCISCKGSVTKIRFAVENGLRVSADVAIHQLHLTENDIKPFDSVYHVMPPLRSDADKNTLRAGLTAGVIDIICSGHQPHNLDAKLGAFPETQAGIASLETLLPLTLQLCRENTLDLQQAIASLTHRPAAILGLSQGALTPGYPADVCIFDPEQIWQVNAENWLSSGYNTPYWGQTLQGKVRYTLQAGSIIYQHGGG